MTRLEITVALVAARFQWGTLQRSKNDDLSGLQLALYTGKTNEEIWNQELIETIKDCEGIADKILASFVAHEEDREWPERNVQK